MRLRSPSAAGVIPVLMVRVMSGRRNNSLRRVQGVELVAGGLGQLGAALACVVLDVLLEPLLGVLLVVQELVGVADVVVAEVQVRLDLDRALEGLDRLLVLLLL